jgi:hypothetical protein
MLGYSEEGRLQQAYCPDHADLAPWLIEEIHEEIRQLGASPGGATATHGIYVQDLGDGTVRLEGSARGPDFVWEGPTSKALDRLKKLRATGAMRPEAIRSEFQP